MGWICICFGKIHPTILKNIMFGYKDPLRQMEIVGGNGMAKLGILIFKFIGLMFVLGFLGQLFGI